MRCAFRGNLGWAGMPIVVKTDARSVASALVGDARKLPGVVASAVNRLASGVIWAEQEEMRRSFDRPTPYVLGGFRIAQRASASRLSAIVATKDGSPIPRVLAPHVPGFGGVRGYKGLEAMLGSAGLLASNEYLVPSRSAPRDAYGNVPRSVLNRMARDLGISAKGLSKSQRFVWGQVGKVRGIWLVKGGIRRAHATEWTLMMRVVRGVHYRPRFDYEGAADRYVADHVDVAAAIDKAFASPG